MKKLGLSVALACAVVLAAFSASLAAGICLDGAACNDFYFDAAKVNAVYETHGYEYGCGYNDRMAFGALRTAGGTAYFGFGTVTSTTGDYGQFCSRVYAIDLGTRTGSYYYNYFYMYGGVDDGHGGSGSASMVYPCSVQAVEGFGPDESQP